MIQTQVNAEYFLGDTGDLVDYDSVVLTIVDSLLFTKAIMTQILRTHSENFKVQFDILAIAYAMVSFAFTMSCVVLFIIIHLNNIETEGMGVSWEMVVILINILIHPYLAAYSSMMRQGIIALDRALKGTQFRVPNLRAFIKYLSSGVFWRILNAVVYFVTFYVYLTIVIVAANVASDARDESLIKVLVTTSVITVIILDIFYFANFVYAIIKRMGGLAGWRHPFNCETYSSALSQAGVRINVDAHQRLGRV